MAIQFPCPACLQPIEVDDEWASREVMCPFCRTTVAAPSASTYAPSTDIPTASPVTGEAAVLSSTPGELPVPPTAGNALAVWALVLAVVALAAYFVGGALLFGWVLEVAGTSGTPQAAHQAMLDRIESGDVPPGATAAALLQLLAFLVWIGGVVCGVVAVRRPGRRGMAIAALVVSGVLPLILCLSLVLAAFMGGVMGA